MKRTVLQCREIGEQNYRMVTASYARLCYLQYFTRPTPSPVVSQF